MTRQIVTIRNEFHDTECELRVEFGQRLSDTQVRRCRKTLCGVDGCRCGGPLGERGPQEVVIDMLDTQGGVAIRTRRGRGRPREYDQERAQLSVLIDQGVRDNLDAVRERLGWSRSQIVQHALELALSLDQWPER